MKISNYKIQNWLFQEADGRFEIDLAESGIQYHHLHDLNLTENYHLNYSLDSGDSKLKEIIAAKYGVDFSEVMITNGSQEALYIFYQTLLKADDHVITFSPGWQQSWDVPIALGANVDVVDLSKHGYDLNLSLIKPYLTDKTKLIILNSPHNPTGKTLSSAILTEIKDYCRSRDIFVLNDEEYLTDYKESIVNIGELGFSGCVSSLSKIFGFPGLRVGWFVGPKETIDQMINYRRYITVCNSHLCERLAEQVLNDFDKYVNRYHNMASSGLEILKKWIDTHPELKLISPQGTPFVYIVFPSHVDTQKFARLLLQQQKVLVMPAEVFDDKNAIRVSFGRPAEILETGLHRMSTALAEYK